MKCDKKVVAMYLPQYHSFPENDAWWGVGFTEWTCVDRARPTIPEHRIKRPHADIGRYNLLDPAVRAKQAEMAREYGIDGFCYYHYWFGDKVLMDSVLEKMLEDGQPDLPFCLSWANEPWTRRMNGGNGELLQANNYGDEYEWERHAAYLSRFFSRTNYIRIDDKPVFVIYRVSQIPRLKERLTFYREYFRERGLGGIFIIMTLGNFQDPVEPFRELVDGVFDFHPACLWQADWMCNQIDNFAYYDLPRFYDRIANAPFVHDRHFLGTMVGFDSSPRSPLRCNVFINGSHDAFARSLRDALHRSRESWVFVNAWNEWGEGCALEPEIVDGYSYLEAVHWAKRAYSLGLL